MAALAAACAANDEFDKAVGWQEKVVDKAAPNQKPLAEKILELYLAKKPFDPKVAQQALSGETQEAEQKAPVESPQLPESKKKRSL